MFDLATYSSCIRRFTPKRPKFPIAFILIVQKRRQNQRNWSRLKTSVDDFISLFADSKFDTPDSVALWQRTRDWVCQRLTTDWLYSITEPYSLRSFSWSSNSAEPAAGRIRIPAALLGPLIPLSVLWKNVVADTKTSRNFAAGVALVTQFFNDRLDSLCATGFASAISAWLGKELVFKLIFEVLECKNEFK